MAGRHWLPGPPWGIGGGQHQQRLLKHLLPVVGKVGWSRTCAPPSRSADSAHSPCHQQHVLVAAGHHSSDRRDHHHHSACLLPPWHWSSLTAIPSTSCSRLRPTSAIIIGHLLGGRRLKPVGSKMWPVLILSLPPIFDGSFNMAGNENITTY